MSRTRRIAKVQCSFELLSIILNGGAGTEPGFRIKTNAPPDLRVVGMVPSENIEDSVWLFCVSEAFRPVLEGGAVPRIEPFTYDLEYQPEQSSAEDLGLDIDFVNPDRPVLPSER